MFRSDLSYYGDLVVLVIDGMIVLLFYVVFFYIVVRVWRNIRELDECL